MATPKLWMGRKEGAKVRKRRREERWMEEGTEKKEEVRRVMRSGIKSWMERTKEV